MSNVRVVAIPTQTAETVRQTMRAPVYGFPAHKEPALDGLPCRHCLRLIRRGEEQAILFTYDRFSGIEDLLQPGPVYIHAHDCPRYAEQEVFPEQLRSSPRTLEAYALGRKLLAQEFIVDGRFEPAIERLFADRAVDYIQVNSTTAGCFTFRIDRA